MRYYYKDNNNNYYNFKSQHSGLISITEQEFNEHNITRYVPIQHNDSENTNKNILKQISEYKQLLKNTDYKAIKYAEGLISDIEYTPIKEQRQLWRNKINELEEQWKNI